jgi:[ribosomal protein S5]-alanine N-acetyltransferase
MDKVIETERLVLRPLRDDDGPEIAAKINSYDIAKNLARVPYPYTLEDAEEFLNWARELDERSAFRVISLKEEPETLIGLISYDWADDKQRAELGYWLVQDQWGKGLMTEAARAMVDLAFTATDLTILGSCFFDENPASGKVLAHAGFEVMGPCTHFSVSRGQEVPVTTVELTREQWRMKKAAI